MQIVACMIANLVKWAPKLVCIFKIRLLKLTLSGKLKDEIRPILILEL